MPFSKLSIDRKNKKDSKSIKMPNDYTSLSSSSSSDSRTLSKRIGKNKHESSSSSRESSSNSGNDIDGLNNMKNLKKTHAQYESKNDQMSSNKKILHGSLSSSTSPPLLISYSTNL